MAIDRETLEGWLMGKSLEELYRLRGEQYGSKDALVEDILDSDDGTLAETLEFEGSFLFQCLACQARAHRTMAKAGEER